MARPFIKWAGGKTQLIPQIIARLPSYIADGQPYLYVEPFAGSAAVALYLLDSPTPPKKVILNDINHDLINLYRVVKRHPKKLLSYLKKIQAEYDQLLDKEAKKPYYYFKRDEFNLRDRSSIEHAGLFMFLNRAGFNGLYRVNRYNQFNVPIGSYKQPKFVFEEIILNASKLLEKVEIYNLSFEDTIDKIKNVEGSAIPTFFYFDPPYKPLSESSSFTSYAKDNFDDKDQKKLKLFCDKLDKSGYQWLLSNSDPTSLNSEDKFFDDLYADYIVERVKASRSINADAAKRGQINELLIRNFK